MKFGAGYIAPFKQWFHVQYFELPAHGTIPLNTGKDHKRPVYLKLTEADLMIISELPPEL